MSFRRGAKEDAGYRAIVDDVIEVMRKATAGKEGRKLRAPIGALCTDVFQPDVVMPEDRIEAGHAVDTETDKGIFLLSVKERALKVFFLTVMIKSL